MSFNGTAFHFLDSRKDEELFYALLENTMFSEENLVEGTFNLWDYILQVNAWERCYTCCKGD